jgi:hypothetical protein
MRRLSVAQPFVATRKADPNQLIFRRNYDRSTATTEAPPPGHLGSGRTKLTPPHAAATERIVVDWHTGLAMGGYDPVAFYSDGK